MCATTRVSFSQIQFQISASELNSRYKEESLSFYRTAFSVDFPACAPNFHEVNTFLQYLLSLIIINPSFQLLGSPHHFFNAFPPNFLDSYMMIATPEKVILGTIYDMPLSTLKIRF